MSNYQPPTNAAALGATVNTSAGATMNPFANSNGAVGASNGNRPATEPAAGPPNGVVKKKFPPRRKQAPNPLRPIPRPLKQISHTVTSMAPRPRATAQTEGRPTITVDELRATGYEVYPLVTTKASLLRNLRHHVLRLTQSKDQERANKRVNITNEKQFTRPIRLHRRDPRAPPSGAGAVHVDEDPEATLEEDKERERQDQAKEARRLQREENQAKIAPSTTKKTPAFQKKTEQIYRPDDTPEAQKRSKIRYEESMPWHLEDFDNAQTWIGQYEAELSDKHVMIVPDQNADGTPKYRIIPTERWYKMTSKAKGRQITADEADKKWAAPAAQPDFMTKREKMIEKREKEEKTLKMAPGRMKTRVAGRGDDDAPIRRDEDGMMIKVDHDADDIDFNYEDDFADDEEGLNGLFEGDIEETKAAEEKIRRDRMGAGVFELRDEKKDLQEEELEEKEAKKKREREKKLRKALMKREKNFDYEQSDSNPYTSSSDSDDSSDVEREKEKARKEAEAKAAAEKAGSAKDGDKTVSGASTKGNNTPSSQSKSVDVTKQVSKKRAGSPNLSEASGNESARKKHKKQHGERAKKVMSIRGGEPQDTAGRSGGGSPSDSEMTDGGRRRQSLKLRIGTGRSPNGTPGGSRAGSPDVGNSEQGQQRAGSPLSASQAASGSSANLSAPSAEEIKSKLTAEGMTIQQMLALFKGRIGDKTVFLNRVKAVSSFDRQRKMIMPLVEKADGA